MFDPIKSSQRIKEQFIDYLATDFHFDDDRIQKMFKSELNREISKGPFLEINDIFKTSKTMDDLINEGILSPLFRDIEKNKNPKYPKILPLDRPLYEHQVQAIEQIVEGNNVVVSTGTGSGKTNCFLIPVINELLREKERGTLSSGIRAIFIFPMNALANDQIKNVRHLLMNYPDITFGVYNGGTEEYEKNAESLYNAMFITNDYEELQKPLPNEFISREKMKDTPPNILFTNYAMLEHLLLRPKDDVLFNASDFKFVVLDEAHVYTGATGIETSILLRRLSARIKTTTKTQFILTSATLGGTKDEIAEFASKISGRSFTSNNIIKGTREKQFLPDSNNSYPSSLFLDLADEKQRVPAVLEKYHIPFDPKKEDSELLYGLLIHSNLYNRLRTNETGGTTNGVLSLDVIKQKLEIDDDTLVAFISLCTKARKNGKSLIDARYHFFIRTLEGCFLTLPLDSNDLKLSLTTKSKTEDGERRMFEVGLCDECGSISIIGKIIDGYLTNTKKFDEEADFYFLANQIDENIEDEELDDEQANEKDKNNGSVNDYYLCPKCGAVYQFGHKNEFRCKCEHTDPIHIIKANVKKNGDVECCKCHSGSHRRLYIGNDGSTSALAMFLYEALPESTYKVVVENDIDSTNPFFSNPVPKNTIIESHNYGQFITFSDSRQEAARFAVYVSQSYTEFLRRRGIYHLIKKYQDSNDYEPKIISDYVAELKRYFDSMNCFVNDGAPKVTNNTQAWIAMIDQLARTSKDNSFTGLGFMQFRYKGNHTPEMDVLCQEMAKEYNTDKETIINLLDLLFLEIIRRGAIKADNPEDLGDDEREYIFYSRKQRYISMNKTDDPNVSYWLPKSKVNAPGHYNNTKLMNYVKEALKLSNSVEDEEKSYKFLKNYFEYLKAPKESNKYSMDDDKKNGTYVMPARNIEVLIAGSPEIKWYRCPYCGKVQIYPLNKRCSVPGCNHVLEEISDVDSLSRDNHFANFYKLDKMIPLVAKEHTAQLDKKESLSYQEEFIKKKINILSCSTTFEMGVDIGDLEAVFLRNIPPTPSNYNQRAGRTGRSIDSAAYVLCFAKLNSHDMYFFDEPQDMINGEILPPYFKLENEKIARRHIYATTLSLFLSENPDYYNNNDADLFLNRTNSSGKKGYEVFYDWLYEKRDNNDPILRQRLLDSIPGDNNFHETMKLYNYGWVDDFIGEQGILSNLIDSYNDTIMEFNSLINDLEREKTTVEESKVLEIEEKISTYRRNLARYTQNEFVDFLAKGNILPKYGFPVDTVELEQNTSSASYSKLNLDRDLKIAIGEYAPSSEVIANGRMYTSRYIKKSVNDTKYTWKKATLAHCKNCDEYTFSEVVLEKDQTCTCSHCGKPIPSYNFITSINPAAGFITEKESKPVPLKRPEKNYVVPVSYIGNAKPPIDHRVISVNGRTITIESTTDDSLLVHSKNPFYVCEQCGYAVSSTDDSPFPGDPKASKLVKDRSPFPIETNSKATHKNAHGGDCRNHTFNCYYLHHTFKTDVAKITFSQTEGDDDFPTMLSTMWAIYNATLHYLQIDRKDLSCCLSPKTNEGTQHMSYSIIIYDAIAGGSGYSRRLVENSGETFKDILALARMNMEKCSCSPSCYKCLRCYENRNYHDDLDRLKAMTFLSNFVS